MVSGETVQKDLNLKCRSKFNPGFTNHGFTFYGCFHWAILKALYGFKEKRAHKTRASQFFFRNENF